MKRMHYIGWGIAILLCLVIFIFVLKTAEDVSAQGGHFKFEVTCSLVKRSCSVKLETGQ